MRKVKRASSVDLQHIRRDDGLPAGDPSTTDTTLLPTAEVSALLNDTSALPTPTDNVSQLSLATDSTSSSIGTVAGTPAPAQAPAKTSQGSKSSCTPSPTKSLAPSATWTTCPYKVHDGKVNPDVRTLPDSPAVVSMSQSVLYNSLAYAMQKTSAYSQSAASFIDAFFLSSKTGMHPNMNFGQMVRGPGKDHQVGTFTGILDLRGLVKVVNGIQLLKAAGSPDWTSARDKEMTSWMNQYITWLQTSDIGKQTASTPNNHFTFYTSQIAAAKLYVGDTNGAMTALQNYFSNQYLDQVAASGEQPFEAVRTRPYHYRCFNLEAMITNAKIGDQLGLNLWSAKSKYGATIQTALDYVMGLSPGSEAVSDIFPHVAAVAAAYGDPKGKYAAFLQKQVSTYKSTPFYFYDQTAALPNSPAAHSTHKRGVDERLGETLSTVSGTEDFVKDAAITAADIAFECPAVFTVSPRVEIDNGIYVTCDELKPFYEISIPFGTNTSALVV
ncbi:chondroitin AC/alginate lyase [Laetiporus sulphureus 93-53]|uniref:Chondroitin AC/alginate lyase n=1 Tax=Laetiporus sulphureus 93-53 TaxID=1314785 RepID=A0A165EEA5_9APHY|nr:chondroitin AC/alginate lyase [Laetiporus sulphureus 93-53]KZT06856.1 chondroitin AC/alginate lyase [Laetiporus sulphureus 93-53]